MIKTREVSGSIEGRGSSERLFQHAEQGLLERIGEQGTGLQISLLRCVTLGTPFVGILYHNGMVVKDRTLEVLMAVVSLQEYST